MKIRTGFVSNSSSSSFVIDKHFLSPYQIEQIKNHLKVAEGLKPNFFYTEDDAEWEIEETEASLSGYTSLNNFPMDEFFELIGIERNRAVWEYY